jgi:hypothetical protein
MTTTSNWLGINVTVSRPAYSLDMTKSEGAVFKQYIIFYLGTEGNDILPHRHLLTNGVT